jgi:hypothetical protein
MKSFYKNALVKFGKKRRKKSAKIPCRKALTERRESHFKNKSYVMY